MHAITPNSMRGSANGVVYVSSFVFLLIILDPSAVKGAMQAFLPKMYVCTNIAPICSPQFLGETQTTFASNALMASLRNAPKTQIQIYERPLFQWTSVLEEKKVMCGRHLRIDMTCDHLITTTP